MKGVYTDLTTVITVDQLCQAIFQDRALMFERHGIAYLRSASLFFTPCTVKGRPLTIYDEHGRPIEEYTSSLCYRSAADTYDTTRLEPVTIPRLG
jgi:hypothetical protein